MLDKQLLKQIIIVVIAILFYYKFVKEFLCFLAPKVVALLKLDRYYSLAKAVGVVELILISTTHVCFCLALIYFLGIPWLQLGFSNFKPIEIVYGMLLGLGVMSITTFSCRLIMQLFTSVMPNTVPNEAKSWIILARGGWMRHHAHNLQILPIYLSLIVLMLQIGSEETVFRGVLLNYFLPHGTLIAITISTTLFVVMQSFQMPSWVSSMFPMVGSIISGIVFSILFVETKSLIPLIIAHITFFMVTVI